MANGLRDRRSLGSRFFEDERLQRQQQQDRRTLGEKFFEEDRAPTAKAEGGIFPDDPPTLRRGINQALAEQSGSFLGARAIGAQLLGDETRSEELQESARIQLERGSQIGPRVQDISTAFESVENLSNFILGGFGRVLPSAATAVAGGGVGGAAGAVAGRALAKRAVSEGVKQSLRRRGRNVGAVAGLTAASQPQESGAIFAEIDPNADTDFSRGEQALLALGGGSAAAALDILPQTRILKRVLNPGKFRKVRQGIIREVGKQAGFEGVTEASQELIQKATNAYIDKNVDVFDENTLNELGTAGALGIIGGGSLGGLSGAAARFAESADVEIPGFTRTRLSGEDVIRGAGRAGQGLGRAAAAVREEIRKADAVVRTFVGGEQGFVRSTRQEEREESATPRTAEEEEQLRQDEDRLLREQFNESLDIDIDALLEDRDLVTQFFDDDNFRAAVEEFNPEIDPGAPNFNAILKDTVQRAAERAAELRAAELRAAEQVGVEQDSTAFAVQPGEDLDDVEAIQDAQIRREEGDEDSGQVQTFETGVRELEGEPSRRKIKAVKGARPEFPSPAQKPQEGRDSTSFRDNLQPGEALVSFDRLVDEIINVAPNQRNSQEQALVGDEEARTPAARQAIKNRVADRLLADLERRGVKNLDQLKALRAEDTNSFLARFETAQSEGPTVLPGETELSTAQIQDIKQRGRQAKPGTRFAPVFGVKVEGIADIDARIQSLQDERVPEGETRLAIEEDRFGVVTDREQRIKQLEAERKKLGKKGTVESRVRLDPRALVKAAINSNGELRSIENRTERAAKAFAEGMGALINQGEINTFEEPADNVVIDPRDKDRPRTSTNRDITYGEIKALSELDVLLGFLRKLREKPPQAPEKKVKEAKEKAENRAKAIINRERKRLGKTHEFISLIEDDLFGGNKRQVVDRLKELKQLEKKDPAQFVRINGESERLELEAIIRSTEASEAEIEIERLEPLAKNDPQRFEELGGEERLAKLKKIVNPIKDPVDRVIYDSAIDEIEDVQGDALGAYKHNRRGDMFDGLVRRIKEVNAKKMGIINKAKSEKRQRTKQEEIAISALEARIEAMRNGLDELASRSLILSVQQRSFERPAPFASQEQLPLFKVQPPVDIEERLSEQLALQRNKVHQAKKKFNKIKEKGGKGVGDRMREQGQVLRDEQEALIALQREASDLVEDGDLHFRLSIGDLEQVRDFNKFRPLKHPVSENLKELRKEIIDLKNKLAGKNKKATPELNPLRDQLDQYLKEEKRLRATGTETLNKNTAQVFFRRVEFLNNTIKELEAEADVLAAISEQGGSVEKARAVLRDKNSVSALEILSEQFGKTATEFVENSVVKKDLYHGTTTGEVLGFRDDLGGAIHLSSKREVASTYSGTTQEKTIEVDGTVSDKRGIYTVKAKIRRLLSIDFGGRIFMEPSPDSLIDFHEKLVEHLKSKAHKDADTQARVLVFEQRLDRLREGVRRTTFFPDRFINLVEEANSLVSRFDRIDAIEFRNVIDPGGFEQGDFRGLTATNYAVLDPKNIFLKNTPKNVDINEVRSKIEENKKKIEVAKKQIDFLNELLDKNGRHFRELATGIGRTTESPGSLNFALGEDNLRSQTREAWNEAKKKVNEYLERTIGQRAVFREKGESIAPGDSRVRQGATSRDTGIIYVSYYSTDPLSTAFHESLHYAYNNILTQSQKADLTAFFGKKKNLNRLIKAIENTNWMKNKAGIIEQISEDSRRGVEERSAYGYQLWMAGEFDPAPATSKVFEFVKKVLRDVLGILATSERADLIFKALRDGSLLRAANDKRPWVYPGTEDSGIKRGMRMVETITDKHLRPFMQGYTMPVSIWARTHPNPVVRKIIGSLVHSPLNPENQATYMEVKNLRARKFAQKWYVGTGWADLSKQQRNSVRDNIYARTAIDQIEDPDVRDYIENFRSFMNEMHQYMADANLEVGYVDSFFPRVWDIVRVHENKEEFLAMMNRHKAELEAVNLTPEEALDAITRADGNELSIPDILTAFAEKKFTKKGLPPELAKELQGKSVTQINDDIKRFAELENKFIKEGNEQERIKVAQKKQAYELWANNVLGTFVHAPGSMSTKSRTFKFLDNEDLTPFLEQNFEAVMSKYVTSVVKRAEFARRFGADGQKLREQVAEARAIGLSPKDEELLDNAMAAVRGTLGTNMNPRLRKISSWLIFYQNFRLLALSAFTATADVSGILMRSQDAGFFWNSMKVATKQIAQDLFPREEIKKIKRRIRELDNKESLTKEEKKELVSLKKQRRELKGDMFRIATEMGAIESNVMHESLNNRFGHEFLYSKSETANNVFFTWTGLEYVTQITRLAGTAAGMSFIKSHASRALDGNARSKEFLAELNLTTSDIVLDEDGEIIISKQALIASGLSETRASEIQSKMELAVNRFVDQAIPRPNAGDRPAQLSNPHLMLILHLKQFIFTFQTQMLNRVGKQAVQGNFKPALYLMSFIPVIMAIDALRHTVQYWWDDPDWDDDWSAADHVFYAAQRGGLLGMTEFAVDVNRNLNKRTGTGVEALGGPTVEQSMDIIRSMLTGNPGNAQTFTEALPAQNLYKNWPIFQDGEE